MKKARCLECNNEIVDVENNPSKLLWCGVDCKRSFLLNNYSFEQAKFWFVLFEDRFKLRQAKVLKEIKESGLTPTEFLHSLGDFKE